MRARHIWLSSLITITVVVSGLVVSRVSGGWAGMHAVTGTPIHDAALTRQITGTSPAQTYPSPEAISRPSLRHTQATQNSRQDNSAATLQPRRPIQVGDTITQDNITAAQAFLTPSTWWMVERGMPMQIAATRTVEWPQAYRDATDKYHAQVELSEDGRRLINYTAGCPFPDIDINDPLAGFRVMWNLEQAPYSTDNRGTDLSAKLINRTGHIERTYQLSWRQLMWTGRLYHEPKPMIPHAPGLRHTSLFGPYLLPHDLAGMLFLSLRYLEPEQTDDTYVYFPQVRRVRRVGVNGRGGPLGSVLGADYDVDSFWGFNAQIARWTFRVLSEKDIFAVVHTQKYGDGSAWCAPQDGGHGIVAALPCVSWEKRRVWVVEALPSEYAGPYPYAKRVLYIDREFFFPLIAESYDRRGELWKSIVHSVAYTKKPYASYPAQPQTGGSYHYQDEWLFVPNWVLIDLQQVRATAVEAPASRSHTAQRQNEWYFNEPLETNTPDVYTPQALMRTG